MNFKALRQVNRQCWKLRFSQDSGYNAGLCICMLLQVKSLDDIQCISVLPRHRELIGEHFAQMMGQRDLRLRSVILWLLGCRFAIRGVSWTALGDGISSHA
jgi:hypothetical protein